MLTKLKVYFMEIILKKVIVRVVRLLVAWAAAQELDKYGIKVDEQGLTLAAYAGITALVNYLKLKFPENKIIKTL